VDQIIYISSPVRKGRREPTDSFDSDFWAKLGERLAQGGENTVLSGIESRVGNGVAPEKSRGWGRFWERKCGALQQGSG